MEWLPDTGARALRCACVLALALLGFASPTRAALTAGAGADYYSGPEGQIVRDVVGYVGTSLKRADLTAAVSRYDHSILGPGTSLTAIGSFTVRPTTLVQVSATRTVGSSDYRAWRLSAGPTFILTQGRWLAFALSRSDELYGPVVTGLTSEFASPLASHLSGSVRGSLASVDGGGMNALGSAGMIWSPARRVQLFGELSFGRDVITLPQSGGGAVPGLAGGVGTSSQGLEPEYVSGPAFLTGVRFTIR